MINLSIYIPILISCMACLIVGGIAGSLITKKYWSQIVIDTVRMALRREKESLEIIHDLNVRLEKFNCKHQPRENDGRFKKRD